MSPRGGARAIAHHVLRRVNRDAAYANLALTAALDRQHDLPPADRALVTELVYGVLRHRRRLDHALSRHTKRALRRVDPDVLEWMRLAAYQILLLDRVPAYAAVDEAVQAVRATRGPKVGGFVNAVLRRVSSSDLQEALPLDMLSRRALELSLPDQLLRRLVRELGDDDAQALAEGFLVRAPLVVRVNRTCAATTEVAAAIEAEGGVVAAGRWNAGALRVSGLVQPFRTQSYLGGLWTAQDEAAQLVSEVLGVRPGEQILDACAGVGGKSTHIAELLRQQACGTQGLLSVDASARKIELLDEHARRLGLECTTRCADLTESDALGGRKFDRILLDAPCSGLGVVRRHPELKWRWREERVEELVALQRRILQTLVRALKPGGILVYSVCTVTEAEGPGQLRWLLERYSELRLSPLPDAVPADLQQDGVLRTWPHRHDTDGFFAARVQASHDEH